MWVWSLWKSIVSAWKTPSALRVAFFVRVKKERETKSSVGGCWARRRDLTSSFKTCMWWRRHTEVSRSSCFCSAIPIEFHHILTLISLYSYLLLSGNKVFFFLKKFTNRTVLSFFQLFFLSFFSEKTNICFIYLFFSSICSVNSLSRWSRQGPLRIQTSVCCRQSRWTWYPQTEPVPPSASWSQLLSFRSPSSSAEERKRQRVSKHVQPKHLADSVQCALR